MAIKGKRKPKSKSKPVARAPRRAPVEIKTPWPQRRWVQVTAAFVVGLFAMALVVWVTNGLRQNRAEADAAASASAEAKAAGKKLAAATAWQTAADGAIAQAGTVNQGLPPTIFVDMSTAIDAMAKKGTVPAGAEQAFADAQSNAKKAIDAIDGFDLTGTIRDQGFDEVQATTFTSSKERMLEGLQLYRRAAQAAALAARSTDPAQVEDLSKLAADLRDSAALVFNAGWQEYQSALRAGGVPNIPPGPIPGLPGGGA
jgi:hypothetical protein